MDKEELLSVVERTDSVTDLYNLKGVILKFLSDKKLLQKLERVKSHLDFYGFKQEIVNDLKGRVKKTDKGDKK